MLSDTELKRLNGVLQQRYGLLKGGLPLFRLVWTTDQTEILDTEFEVWSGPIYVRTERGPRRRPKYPMIPNRYCVEVFSLAPPELPEKPYTYEGTYFFQDKDQNYLEPIEVVVCYIAKSFLLAQDYKPLSEAAVAAMTKEEDEKAEEYFEEFLENETPYTALKLGWGEAVSSPFGEHKIGGKECAPA